MDDLRVFAVALFAALTSVVAGCTANTERDIPALERQAHALNKSIMCPVCPGESIDQSQNPLAASMRGIVAEKLENGWTDRQIKDFFVERYGPSVLLEPPGEGIGLAAWLLPPVAVAVAVGAVLVGLRWMRRTTPAAPEASAGPQKLTGDDLDAYSRRIEAALDMDSAPEDARES